MKKYLRELTEIEYKSETRIQKLDQQKEEFVQPESIKNIHDPSSIASFPKSHSQPDLKHQRKTNKINLQKSNKKILNKSKKAIKQSKEKNLTKENSDSSKIGELATNADKSNQISVVAPKVEVKSSKFRNSKLPCSLNPPHSFSPSAMNVSSEVSSSDVEG